MICGLSCSLRNREAPQKASAMHRCQPTSWSLFLGQDGSVAKIQNLRFGDLNVQVAVIQLPGTEETSAADRLRDRAVDALQQAELAIEAVARSAADTVRKLKAKAISPSSVEIELGLAFTAQGGVVVAGAGVEASIVVHLTYDASQRSSSETSEGKAESAS
jgi:hypothetical protein